MKLYSLAERINNLANCSLESFIIQVWHYSRMTRVGYSQTAPHLGLESLLNVHATPFFSPAGPSAYLIIHAAEKVSTDGESPNGVEAIHLWNFFDHDAVFPFIIAFTSINLPELAYLLCCRLLFKIPCVIVLSTSNGRWGISQLKALSIHSLDRNPTWMNHIFEIIFVWKKLRPMLTRQPWKTMTQ